jgi:HPt (histidine-containing phosphotransfer) domain-containing protein
VELDAETLAQIRQYGDELLRELFETYLEHAPGRFEGMLSGIAAGDHESAEKLAHSLRSSSVSIGGAETAECAAEVERALRDGREGDLPDLVAALEASYHELTALLRARLDDG